jgi:serine/threonine-protein kinase
VDGDLPFLVMDLLEGRTLEAALVEGLPLARVVPIVRDVLRALAYAHGLGLVHRDLKPANVFLQQVPELGEVVRVLDFGLAKFVEVEEPMGPTLTRAGTVLGTPAYMPPEQATGEPVDARADVYSLGIMLFEMVTGQRPFNATDGPELVRMHLLKEIPRIHDVRPQLDLPKLDEIIARAAAKTRGDRYADAAAMAAALDALGADVAGPKTASIVTKSSPSIDVTVGDEGGATRATSATAHSRPAASQPAAGGASKELRLGVAVAFGVATVIAMAAWLSSGTGAPIASSAVPSSAVPPSTTVSGAPPSMPPPSSTVPASEVPSTVVPSTVVPSTAVPSTAVPSSVVAPPSSVVPSSVVPPPAASGPVPFDAPTPPQLVAIEARVREGRALTGPQRQQLVRFSSNHPHDARGWILLAHSEVTGDSLREAVTHYERALAADEDARRDPTTQADLVRLVTDPHVGDTAMRSARTLDPSAVSAIDALAPTIRDRGATRRLTTLRAALAP